MRRVSAARLRLVLVLVALALPASAPAATLPLLHPLFADHAVLQRGVPVPVWGWADPETRATVRFASREWAATTGGDGRWVVTLDAMSGSSESRDLTVTFERGTGAPVVVAIHDVLVGDVWLCSGQSNMEFALEQAANGAAEVAAAHVPKVRLFSVARTTAARPRDVPGAGYTSWQPATPETASQFSAIGYFFGRALHESLGVPVGLIDASWGGTMIESWTSAEALAAEPASAAQARDLAADTAAWTGRHHEDALALVEESLASRDPGSAGASFADPRLDDATWSLADTGTPGRWPALGLAHRGGIVWYRRTVDVPPAWAGDDLTLVLGPIDVQDRTWFNGQSIGQTLVPWESRSYTVPGALVAPGPNVIAVRVLADGDAGGFAGDAAGLRLSVETDAPILLAGGWRYRAGPDAAALGRVPYRMGADPWVPASLWNGQIAPLVPFALRGFLWYQGEQNTSAPERYRALLASLIADWRARFGGATLPFGIVQLANFGARVAEPHDSTWAALREAQRQVAQQVPATGLAVTIDIGEAADIHPKNKQEVGRRLARWALSTVYGQGGEWSGPLYRAATIEGDRIRIEFDHVGGGLLARNGALTGFTIAGPDGRFVPADARIERGTVVVASPSVTSPAAVRYAWDDDPEVSLFNTHGLPASPFRTDDWPRREKPQP